MRKRIKHKRILNFILIPVLTLCAISYGLPWSLTVKATNVSEVETQIEENENEQNEMETQIGEHESELEEMEAQLTALTDQQDLLQELIDDINAEIINTTFSIEEKEEEIAAKEQALELKHEEVLQKQKDIDETYEEYLKAKEREEQQYSDMLRWMKCMYENTNISYLAVLLNGNGLSEILNQMDYIEKVYEYGLKKLGQYENTKVQVKDLWHLLEIERALMKKEEVSLQEEKEQLKVDKKTLQAQKSELDTMLSRKKTESAAYQAEINSYMQEALVLQELLVQEREQLQQLQEEQRKLEEQKRLEELERLEEQQRLEELERLEEQQRLEEEQQQENETANGNNTDTGYTSAIDNASGSDLGKKVAKYACQYIGNPYVYGGTSLTSGADCSGFVYRVYKDFGYNLPRTSYEQRSVGNEVALSNAQPGDLICYDGHVGIYIGDGKIVHASNSNPYPRGGIKISNMDYRPILAVRRVV